MMYIITYIFIGILNVDVDYSLDNYLYNFQIEIFFIYSLPHSFGATIKIYQKKELYNVFR